MLQLVITCMIKKIILLLGLLLIFLSGIWVASYFYNNDRMHPEEQSIVLLEQIEKVSKLVTVEGHFVEYYDYTEPEQPWFVGPLLNYRAFLPKKAAKLRIQAKVLVGYDLQQMQIDAFPDELLIRISNIPAPDIIAIEHKIDQFDNDATIFRPLESIDYVRIDKGAQEKIRKLAMTSRLIDAANEQGNEMLQLIEFLVDNAGWRIEIESNIPSLPDSLVQ